ncbi:hypothetical protein DMC47_30270 [Nostoc sp. 3335mG]|nr:hypothetical protein DMC47_30270 [Nostoc sp. 3335mG]
MSHNEVAEVIAAIRKHPPTLEAIRKYKARTNTRYMSPNAYAVLMFEPGVDAGLLARLAQLSQRHQIELAKVVVTVADAAIPKTGSGVADSLLSIWQVLIR